MNNIETLLQTPKAQLEIIIDRELSTRSFYEFFLLCMENIYTHIEFVNNWHYEVTCNILQER